MNRQWSLRIGAALAALACATLLRAATSFTPDSQPIGYVGQLEVTNYVLTSGTEVVFKTDYDRNTWTGNVHAYPVDASGVVALQADWWNDGAASHIDAQDFNTGRIIVTDDGKANASGKTFRWNSLSGAQQGLLGTSTTGPQVLNFVRGDQSLEKANGGTFRDRSSVLGDILHTRPYYLQDPNGDVLFVGANDGMLHAIDARTAAGGGELWAFVPSTLLSKLPSLTVDPYVHTYFVDGGLNVGTVTISGSQKNVLVGTLGAGGRGVFGIDVTNPHPATETAAAANVLWEVNSATSASYSNLGYTYSTPVLATVNTGASAVILGNGYNSAGVSSLFVLDLKDGSVIKEVKTSGAVGGGLSTPVCIDTNNDQRVDTCYAGDIDGKLWKFDLSNTSANNWTASLLYTTSPAQAITSVPAVGMHPNGGYMVNFATGRLLTTADQTDTSVFYAYGIWDGAPAANTTLLQQTLTERSYVNGSTSNRVRVVTANAPNWSSGGNRGWQVPLPLAGERVTGDTLFIENNRFYFATTNPTVLNASPTPDGALWLMELDFLSGSTANSPFFDLSGDLQLTNADRVSYVSGDTLPTGAHVGDINTTATGVPVGKFIDDGVGSQPLLVQLATLNTTLLNENPDVTLPALPGDPGVAGGHFDFDIYYGGGAASSKHHVHQYDDIYDVTGVNMLNASDSAFNLSKAITNTSTQFKVLVQNQYLNPAATLSIGGQPYTNVKLYNGQAKETSAANVIANAPVYTRSSPGFTLAFNLPVDAFTNKNWWDAAGGTGYAVGDVRAGLIPTETKCVNTISGSGTAASMYNSVIPPANGVDGPGTNSTTSGVRHNGALVIQLISASTAASEIEMAVPGRPEYGWRVTAANYATRVLAEYTTFWHNPSNICFGAAGWTKTPAPDNSNTKPKSMPAAAAGSTDPKVGSFKATSSVVSVTTTVNGNVTTVVTTFADHTTQTITRTKNADGTLTIYTVNPDGTTTTDTEADTEGTVNKGADEKRTQAITGRISWTERRRN
ncbi:hypothetical protein JJB11_20370 [Ramlibacter ginsenosidimutans]|uniref:PilY1 beta-propeller domain-containing protein n=1 Tax=Ramlibacter ginsenosidimutans TaxID=502333 RepID=A0A934WN30_9BURK|nr:PilC/PilY family type IV pilus protein [Ramlibacter ginsenosidimutans]MBK6008464.1 hypothetical protein [Ramlibacter ginsenosidimutans]